MSTRKLGERGLECDLHMELGNKTLHRTGGAEIGLFLQGTPEWASLMGVTSVEVTDSWGSLGESPLQSGEPGDEQAG